VPNTEPNADLPFRTRWSYDFADTFPKRGRLAGVEIGIRTHGNLETSKLPDAGREPAEFMESWWMKKSLLIVFASLTVLFACSGAQTPLLPVTPNPLLHPMVSYSPASGCEGEHETVVLPGAYINAYPSLPPKAEPDHLVMHLLNGTTVWSKPLYGSEDCADYISCRRASLALNPLWNQCTPHGVFYEVATVDGKPVLESNFWQVIEPSSKASAYVAFTCNQGYVSPNLAAISNRTAQTDCLYPTFNSPSSPVMMASAISLAATYFNYRAAYQRPIRCVSEPLSGTTRSTRCY
jgi:hypothetical protein